MPLLFDIAQKTDIVFKMVYSRPSFSDDFTFNAETFGPDKTSDLICLLSTETPGFLEAWLYY